MSRAPRNATNPWQRNQQQHKKSQHNSSPEVNKSEIKFKEAQKKLQAAVQKYVKEYDSSSEEEELETNNIIGLY